LQSEYLSKFSFFDFNESRFVRKVLALCATASVLALAACGSGSSSDLSKISVKPAADDKTAPEVSFDTPFVTDKDEAVNIKKGDGADVNPGDTVSIKSGLYKAIDGLSAGENFTGAATDMTVDDTMKEQMPELYERLSDSKVGDWIAYSTVEGTQQADGSVAEPAEGAKAERIIVLHVEDSTTASGTMSKDDVAKQKKEGKLPTVKVTDDKPTITIPKDTEAPKDLAVDVLEEGKGEAATATSKVKAKYSGVTWADGKEFDGNFGKDSTEFSLDQVIKGWTEGMTGLKAGSKVLLTIPADKAYGNTSSNGSPTGPLVFYVELESVTAADSK